MSRLRQGELIADSLQQLVRSGEHLQFEGEIGGAARHRTDNGEVAADRDHPHLRRDMTTQRYEVDGGPVRENTAEMRRPAQ